MIALDASALLAFLFGEPGGAAVGEVLDDCCLSAVSLSEVGGRFARDGHDPELVVRRLEAAGIELGPFAIADAALAASLRRKTDVLGLSLGDRACLALAMARGIPALTADRLWAKLDVGIEVRLLRR
jgi:ribonuclease VapC